MAKSALGLFAKTWDRVALRRLSRLSDAGATLSRAIRQARKIRSVPSIEQIEAGRKRLLANASALVDGTAGAPGIYDEGSVADACRKSKSARAARLLYSLTYEVRPKAVIELGTNVGISSAYLAAGLKDSGSAGRVWTLDSSRYRLRLAQDLHRHVGLDNVTCKQGLFIDILGLSLEEAQPIEMAFVDGHHQYQPTLDYFDTIWKKTMDDCVFVFDDIRWSDGMKKAWRELCRDPRVAIAIDVRSVGICITGRTASSRPHRTRLIAAL